MALSQNKLVLQYMEDHGSIDTYRAMTELGVFRLSARINNLRSLGYMIISVMKERVLEDGTVKRWAEYSLAYDD